jgi:NAD(P)-dependent dehydrogenase (short-subunit alcohol dehydrogenase family)
MESFSGKVAVVTGGGSGMGRELVRQLAAEGCAVATCDIDPASIEATVADVPPGVRVTAHVCDVSDEAQVLAFRDEVTERHATDHLDLLFNNAGVGGGGSFLADSRAEWERTFAIDWWGVYYCARAFLPLLIASEEAVLVNTSSVNGFWASLGPGVPHTAYCTAKFAVKGFSESLIEDLRVHAPHVHVAVVMPGHIGTNIVTNSWRVHGKEPAALTPAELAVARAELVRRGVPVAEAPDDAVRQVLEAAGTLFRDRAPLAAAGAASVILEAVRAGRWRILVGDDAVRLDEQVRARPEAAYDPAAGLIDTIWPRPEGADAAPR